MIWRSKIVAALLVAAGVAMIGAASPSVDPDQALYLKRLAETPANGRESYDTMEPVPGANSVAPLTPAAKPSIPAEALQRAAAYAAANNSKAFLVWRRGSIQISAYGRGADAQTPINSASMAKPLGSVAVGRAIALGLIKSLDEPAADFLPEWRGTPKAAVTLRQLFSMTAGLAQQGPIGDPASIMSRSYLHPRHGEILINEYPLTDPPGAVYQYSNASAELIAPIIERASGRRYARFISEEVLKPLGAAGGEVWVDRPGGMAHSGCCILLPAETWLRLGLLLMNDGVANGRRLLPEGYVAAMKTPTAANPRYGLGVWIQGTYTPRRGFGRPDQLQGAVLHSEPYLADDLFLFDGNRNQVLYIVPSQDLLILRMGDAPPKNPEWDNSFLPNLLLRAISGSHSG